MRPAAEHVPGGLEAPHLTTADLAKRWKCGQQTLENMRSNGEGPPYVVIGTRMVRYRITDVEKYEAAQLQGGA